MRISTLLIIASTLAFATPAAAQGRPDTRQMTCDQARLTVQRAGGIVLSTGPRTYDRFVSGLRYCASFERLRSRWVPTSDVPQCFIGYSCAAPRNSGDRFFFD
ncbi:hypothetical protein [Pseudovibrio japonicus]|uniref:hypothetical protein n=1 Tax=Pseudovibrio japonicus TaxID=366534 RepID=UPI00167A459E|nr:hypothetical protein [Pseudovibrio japonicus]